MTMVHENADKFKQIHMDQATIRIEIEDVKSLKLEMAKSLQTQKDCVNSNFSIKKQVAEIKAQLNMVYGKELFNRRN